MQDYSSTNEPLLCNLTLNQMNFMTGCMLTGLYPGEGFFLCNLILHPMNSFLKISVMLVERYPVKSVALRNSDTSL